MYHLPFVEQLFINTEDQVFLLFIARDLLLSFFFSLLKKVRIKYIYTQKNDVAGAIPIFISKGIDLLKTFKASFNGDWMQLNALVTLSLFY